MARRTPLVHFNGRIVPAEEAVVSALSPALSHGPIAYDTLLVTWNEEQRQSYIFRLQDHLRRLIASMRILRFETLPTIEDLEQSVIGLARANAFSEDAHFRIQVIPEERDERRQVTTRIAILIVGAPRSRAAQRPVSCQTSTWRRPGDDSQPARVKAVGMRMFARVAMAQAKADGYDQALLLNESGKVAESVSSNVFLVRGGRVVTPARSASILEGITRSTLITLLQSQDVPCEEREVDRSELYDCDEAFLCSTALGVLPIASVDRLPVCGGVEGPVTGRLRGTYDALLQGMCPERKDWLTPVYDRTG